MRVRGEGPLPSFSAQIPSSSVLTCQPGGAGRGEKPCPSGVADTGPVSGCLKGVEWTLLGTFVATQGPPTGLLWFSLLLQPQESKVHPGPPPWAVCPSWQPMNLRESSGWLTRPWPTLSPGRHTPFAELGTKRDAADTGPETDASQCATPVALRGHTLSSVSVPRKPLCI